MIVPIQAGEDLPHHPHGRRDPRASYPAEGAARGAHHGLPRNHGGLQRRDQGRRFQAARGDGRSRPAVPDRRLPLPGARPRAPDRGRRRLLDHDRDHLPAEPRHRPGGGQLVDLTAPCADVRRGHGLLPAARVAVRREAAKDGVRARGPARGDPRSGAADGGERHDRDRGAADDARRGLRGLPHLRARDCDRDRRRPALRSHAAARDPEPPRAPRVLAERRSVAPGADEAERGSARWRRIALRVRRRPAATSASPSPCSSSAPSGLFCSGRPTSTRSGSSGRPRRLERGLRDPEVGIPCGRGQSHRRSSSTARTGPGRRTSLRSSSMSVPGVAAVPAGTSRWWA